MTRETRKSMMGMAKIWQNGRELGRVRVRNLSRTGLGATGYPEATKGEALTIELAGIGQVDGSIVWVADKAFGLQFDREIEKDAFDLGNKARAADVVEAEIPSRWRTPPKDCKRPALGKI